jgi:hypothetical protein
MDVSVYDFVASGLRAVRLGQNKARHRREI